MIVTASVSVTAMPDAGQVSYTDIDCFPATVSVDCNNVQLVPLRLSATLRSGADNNPVDVFWRAHIQSVGSDLGTVDSPGASAQWEYSLPSDKWGKADSVVVEAYTDSSRLDMIAQKRVGIIRQNPSPFPLEGGWKPLPFKYKNGECFLEYEFIYMWMNPVSGNSSDHPLVDATNNPDTTSWKVMQEYPVLGTQLLLAKKIKADLIDVDNLAVKFLKASGGGGKEAINVNGVFKVLDNGAMTATSGTIGGFSIGRDAIGTVDSNSTYMTANRIYSGKAPYGQSPGHNAFIGDAPELGMALGNLYPAGTFETWGGGTIGAGNVGLLVSVQGSDRISDAKGAFNGNHALYVPHGHITGFRLKTRRVSSSQELSLMDSIIIATRNDIELTLPSSAEDGQIYFIRNWSPGNIYIRSSKRNIRAYGDKNMTTDKIHNEVGQTNIIFYDKLNDVWFPAFTNRW